MGEKQTRKQFRNMGNDAGTEDKTDISDIDNFKYNSMVNDDASSDDEDLEETLNDQIWKIYSLKNHGYENLWGGSIFDQSFKQVTVNFVTNYEVMFVMPDKKIM